MKRFLLLCFIIFNIASNAQITLGAGSASVGVAPISTYYGYSYVQQIFTKNEINANAAGNITGLKFYLSPGSSIANSSNWKIYLGTTSKTTFTSNSNWIPLSQLTQVFSGTVSSVSGVVTITFPVPYNYNNLSNLVIAAEENSAGYDENGFDDAFFGYNSTASSVLYFQDDTINPNPLSPPTGSLGNKKSAVTFSGLNSSSTIACPDVTYPQNNALFIPLLPTITWNAVSGATGYKVTIGTLPGGSDIVNQQTVSTNSFLVPASLAANSMYYLKVVAVNASGESQGCSTGMFRTTPGQPGNDECANAITLTVNPNATCTSSVQGYTLGATNSGSAVSPCYGNADDDVWFKFIATATSHKISLNNVESIGTVDSDDIYFQVFSGSCGSLSSVLCSDPSASLVTGLTVGSTYYVRVYSYDGAGSNQSFNICIGTIPPPPANDVCSAAVSANIFPFSYTQNDALGATNSSGFLNACTDGMNDGTWFSFVGNGGNVDVIVTMPAGSSFDPQVGVFTGNCGSLVCFETEDTGGDGEAEIITLSTVAGTIYYINVGHYDEINDDFEDTFTINISSNFLLATEVSPVKDKVRVYPNPFSEMINISDAENVKSMFVSDMAGRTLRNIENPASVILLNELKSGMYIVTLMMKDGSKQSLKIIKK
ncbi:T9SS type A sorting domain-containing protein [Chryseobacterium wangxinyae]|uniref:T9SS type A sorting domain-containing protein n=1 Tax=Chryseobacterium sp. CY350 TaxID=2997336 RepID=UPI00226FE2B7|nr:T9SS type A sorting domain-containing protein [Chryseobacterium sp. CY350]MCY0977578.1 T9SS type A sorting domain-containing protein [Chryseobacterium sp. CY350]WBZ95412.1 T9SS type A sorting domain-containing protein [Chryseobacterium sp. CY350]